MSEKEIYSKDFLRDIASALERADFEGIGDERHEFSDSFEKRMESLAALVDRPRITGGRILRVLIAAIIIIALIIGTMSVTAQKSPQPGFYMNVYRTHSDISFLPTDPESGHLIADGIPSHIDEVYRPTYIPDGYDEESVTANDWLCNRVKYRKPSGSEIIFEQFTLHANLSVDTEDAPLKVMYVDDLMIYYNYKNRLYHCYWIQGKYAFSLFSSCPLGETVRIIRSVERV